MIRGLLVGLCLIVMIFCSSCATLLPLALNPAETINQISSDAAQQLTQTDVGNGVDDLNRIIDGDPNGQNSDNLRNLRDKLTLNQSKSRSSLPEDDPKRELQAEGDRRVRVSFFRSPSDEFSLDTTGQFQQPFGLRNTPRTHMNTDLVAPRKEDKNVFDPTPVRFEQPTL